MNTQQLLSVSVTPVVLISASGLITLALYNRLSVILARIRVFHQQKIGLLESRRQQTALDYRLLLEMVDSQVAKVTAKAKMIQRGLFCLLGASLAFLSCSLLTALSVFHESIGMVALVAHLIGLTLFAGGLGWAMRELMLSVSPLEEEGFYLDSLVEQHNLASAQAADMGLDRAA